jgi:hypothetical protein
MKNFTDKELEIISKASAIAPIVIKAKQNDNGLDKNMAINLFYAKLFIDAILNFEDNHALSFCRLRRTIIVHEITLNRIAYSQIVNFKMEEVEILLNLKNEA